MYQNFFTHATHNQSINIKICVFIIRWTFSERVVTLFKKVNIWKLGNISSVNLSVRCSSNVSSNSLLKDKKKSQAKITMPSSLKGDGGAGVILGSVPKSLAPFVPFGASDFKSMIFTRFPSPGIDLEFIVNFRAYLRKKKENKYSAEMRIHYFSIVFEI